MKSSDRWLVAGGLHTVDVSAERSRSIAMRTDTPGASRLAARDLPVIRRLGLADYETTWRAMQGFTAGRTSDTRDEFWLLQHPPVYTLGVAGRSGHLRGHPTIPVIRTDRGGQITYHGPGQMLVYVLIDLRRINLSVRELVRRLEISVVDLLSEYGIAANGRPDAPGVYVAGAKIAALGLRIRNGCSYHGLSFNVDMDLHPFHAIDPCGYPGLRVTQARDQGIADSVDTVGEKLLATMLEGLYR
jgi:lipoyl(octanoyl) transferase